MVHSENYEVSRSWVIALKTVLVFGNFKAVHLGHFRLFEYAKSLGDSLVVAIKIDERNPSSNDFSESLIASIKFVSRIVKYTDLGELLADINPTIVVRGQEFKNSQDFENDLIQKLGFELVFGSGSTHLSEIDFGENAGSGLLVRDSFKQHIRAKNVHREKLLETIKNFANLRVTVVGDVIIDEFISCQAIGMSQEDPVVVSTPVANSKYLGGAGIVAAHCKAMGAQVRLVSLVGDDDAGHWAERKLSAADISVHFITDKTRPTVVKQRYKNSNHTLFRLTHFRAEEPGYRLLNKLVEVAKPLIEKSDVLIFSDFSYGTLHSTVVNLLQEFVNSLKSRPVITADSQSSSQLGALSKFKGVNLVTPTEYEARIELRNDVDGIAAITQHLGKLLEVDSLILKLGADGVLIGGFQEGNEAIPTDRIPSLNGNPVDVSGAGDSLLAISSLTLASGHELYETALMGSIAAGVQVSRRGNVPIEVHELEQTINEIFL